MPEAARNAPGSGVLSTSKAYRLAPEAQLKSHLKAASQGVGREGVLIVKPNKNS